MESATWLGARSLAEGLGARSLAEGLGAEPLRPHLRSGL